MSKKKTSKAKTYKKLRDELFKQFAAVLNGIQIDIEKGVILTPEKRRQIAKYKQIKKKLENQQRKTIQKPQK